MRYLFSEEWHEVPVYAPYEGCRRIAIQYSVPAERIAVRDQRLIEPSWRKLSAFLFAEGPAATLRKVRSKRAVSELNSDYYVVFAVGRDIDRRGNEAADTDPTYLCLGLRHPPCSEVMLFPEELAIAIDLAPLPQVLAAAVGDVLARQSETIQKVGGFNVYSDLPVPPAAVSLLETVAGSLQPAGDELGETVPHLPRVIFPPPRTEEPAPLLRARAQPSRQPVHGAAVIAAGDYVRTEVIPALKRAGFTLRVIADLEPYLAAHATRHFGFERAETDWRRTLDDRGTDVVVVATYHDTHAAIAAEALSYEKKVLLEKPPVVTREDLEGLLEVARRPGTFLDIGYNRRYAPFARAAKEIWAQGEGPTTIVMVVKEVDIPAEHWYRWPKEGTRVTGNLCHWIDFAFFILGADRHPQEMTVSGAGNELDEERAFSILFDDGSLATIVATQRGDPTLGVQELIEIRRSDLSIRIDDFRRLLATRSGRTLRRAHARRDKGHGTMYDEMLRRAKTSEPSAYTLRELARTSSLTILATEMVRNGTARLALSNDEGSWAIRSRG